MYLLFIDNIYMYTTSGQINGSIITTKFNFTPYSKLSFVFSSATVVGVNRLTVGLANSNPLSANEPTIAINNVAIGTYSNYTATIDLSSINNSYYVFMGSTFYNTTGSVRAYLVQTYVE